MQEVINVDFKRKKEITNYIDVHVTTSIKSVIFQFNELWNKDITEDAILLLSNKKSFIVEQLSDIVFTELKLINKNYYKSLTELKTILRPILDVYKKDINTILIKNFLKVNTFFKGQVQSILESENTYIQNVNWGKTGYEFVDIYAKIIEGYLGGNLKKIKNILNLQRIVIIDGFKEGYGHGYRRGLVKQGLKEFIKAEFLIEL